MKRLLAWFYNLCGVLAGVLMIATGGLVLASALVRPFGGVVPDANALAGFCFAAMIFLGLAPTLRNGGHIRVSLILGQVPPRARHGMELWCLTVTLLLVGYLAYWMVHLTIASWRFGDVSPGVLAVPLWIPQAAMAVGAVAMAVALLDNLMTVIRGGEPDYERLAESIDDDTADR